MHGIMIRHKMHQLFLSPSLLLTTICLLLPQCMGMDVCPPENTIQKELNITENFADGFSFDFQSLFENVNSNSILDYTFSGNENVFNRYFRWENIPRYLYTRGQIDRELIALELLDPYSPVTFQFDILLFNFVDLTLDGCINVTLNVIDLDDNSPTFGDASPVIFDEDNEAVGKERQISIAVDHDEGRNGTSVYQLFDDSGKFELVYSNYTNTPRVQTLYLKNTSPLDYEQQSSYNLQLRAREDNDAPDEDILDINVVVRDKCDEPPTFTTSRYTPSVFEDAMPDHHIVTVEATDADSRALCPLAYTITRVCEIKTGESACTSTQGEPFVLDSESGRLTLLQEELDRETITEYQVTVQATDNEQSSATATVVISIEDINDNDPEITGFTSLESIGEHQSPDYNRAITHFTVADADAGRNGQVSVVLLDNSTGVAFVSETFKLKTTNQKRYQIILNQSLDYETQTEYSLLIHVKDNGTQPRFANKTVSIRIDDHNDHPPVFLDIPSVMSIPENSVLNTEVLTVTATDSDDGKNARVTFELPESNATYPYQHLFQIEPEIGLILVGNGNLDYEEATAYTILVVAINSQSSNPLSSSVEVTIPLENTNDNKPRVTVPVNPIEVSENTASGMTIGEIFASDADNLGTLNYSLTNYNSLFSISGSGIITLDTELDYETVPSYLLFLEVSDGLHTTTTNVTIRVLPENDEKPSFNQNTPYIAMIAEEADDIIFVIEVTASDLDTPSQELVYSIVGGAHLDRFSINQMGEIYTTESLDRETSPNYTLSVQVSDGSFNTMTDVIIIVTDVNDHTPHFVNQPYIFEIEERNAEIQTVGTVEVVSLDTGDNQNVRFEITNGNGNNWFTIGESSGVIETNRILDYETDPSSIILTVIVSDFGTPPNMNITTVTVVILDYNDNGPKFQYEQYTFTLREDHPIGQVFDSVVADDIDGIGNNITRYSFSEGTDTGFFHIEEFTGELSLVSSLDYETTDSMMFGVIATDAKRGDLQTSPTTVIINITNAKDLNLTFPHSFSPHFSVIENIEENYTITSFEVTDTMMNSVNRLEYTLTTLEDTPSPYFGIRKDSSYTAHIYTRTHNINREADDLGENKMYELKLTVTDPDTTSDSYGSIVSYLTFEILDENDNKPMFVNAANEFSVRENGDAGELVASIEVKDPDAGNNGTIQLVIESVVPFSVTHVEKNNGKQFADIRVVSPLDREVQANYQFLLRAADMGTPPKSQTIEINVHVLDENDNDPKFCPEVKCQIDITVKEDHPIHQVIHTLHANDPDAGTNAEIRYEVVPGDLIGSKFSLETSTGRIILVNSLDRETIPQYEFEVRAVDGGNRASTATVIIKVDDVNEYSPVFINSSFTITISEDITTGIPFTSLIAEDQDAASNAVIKYDLADESLKRIFCLDKQTGEISICSKTQGNRCRFPEVIDYERTNEYKVGIIAYDQGIPGRYSNGTLTVHITDVNEHPPLFDVSSHLYSLMSENARVGSTILEIQAYDGDTADNLQYTLVQDDSNIHFQWDSGNKAIILSKTVDYITNPALNVTLSVSDGAKSSEIRILILVLNENNHRPVFETEDDTLYLSENAEVGATVFTVHATDADNATNDAVIYSISDGNINNTFYINPKTGVVYIAQDLDYETESTYTLTIVATDTGAPAMTSEPVHIQIMIVNENDEIPTFEQKEYTFNLVENNDEMALVGCVKAEDVDDGDFGMVVYSFTEESKLFSIDKNSGCISALHPIDREYRNKSMVTVLAQDNENPAKSGTADVTVVIRDANDNGPKFSQASFLFYISFEHDISQSVGIVTASDSDSGENALFVYRIITQDPNLEISLSANGEVNLVTAIPSNYQASYSTAIRVSSSVDGDTRFDDAVIVIMVESETDHHPRFTQPVYVESVFESVHVGYNIFDASKVVTDEDSTTGLRYEFDSSYEQFALDSETGLLTLQSFLDYEDVDNYEIQIRVIDSFSGLLRTSTATLQIMVEDVNDHAPVFTVAPTNIILSPVPYTNIELFAVVAEDEDIEDEGAVGYSIIEDSSSTFAIDPDTGVVTNKVNLITNDTYVFVIRAFDHGSPLMSSNITVQVRIDDTAETPQFTNGDTTIGISLPESKSDRIIREFSTQPVADSYHLVYSNASKNMFGIDMDNTLVLNSHLDYETASQYQLIIEARSMSNGMRLSSFLLVNIIVTDVNDNEPYFLPIPNQEMSESQPTDRVLFTVEARDDDSGNNANILYAITAGNIGNAFDIHPSSGDVTLVQPLNREVTPCYNLTIRARDSGTPPMHNETTVFIKVTDVNDNPPRFSKSNYSISVFEHPHTVKGDSIIQIVAEDVDIGHLSYYIELLEATYRGFQRNPPSDTFKIDFDTGNITTRRNLDREEVDSYFIRIEARDTADEHSAFAYLTVHVKDVNDHAPVFSNRTKETSVYELLPENTVVLGPQMVTDRDMGPNGLVKYSLGNSWPAGMFKIDPWSGVIRVDRPFAFDKTPSNFNGTVVATDQGVPALTGTMTVTVTIVDVNNFPPVLEESHFNLQISVDHSVDTPITTFNSSDKGDSIFNTVAMIKIPNYYTDVRKLFQIKGETLNLREVATSDDIGNHSFLVEAIQQSSVPYCPQYVQTTYAPVTVTIHPANMHAPVFPSQDITVEVDETITTGTALVIPELIANDADGNKIFYSIVSSENIPFAILDPAQPAISTTRSLDVDSVGSITDYTITVEARDNGFPVQRSNTTLTIHIMNVNELTPQFEKEQYSGSVVENSDTRIVVLSVRASDPDNKDTIRYSIEHPENCNASCLPFIIDPSGKIFTTKIIDYEDTKSYMFRVKASDSAFSSYASVVVNVLGVNEYTPAFETKMYTFTVEANQANGSLVGKVAAIDEDSDEDGKLHYSFVGSIDEQYDVVVIDEASGEIFLNIGVTDNSRRKREVDVTNNAVTITTVVRAEDSSEFPKSDTAEVVMTFDKSIFAGRIGSEPAANPPFEIIIIVVIAVVGAIVVFVAIIVSALLFRRYSRSKKLELKNVHGTGGDSMEMAPELYRQSNNGTSVKGKVAVTKTPTGNSASGSEHSYTGTADDEMDSGNEGVRRYSGNSSNLPNKHLRHSSPRVRSTSDLASSVGTDALHSQTTEHPYTKAQLMRIYAANEELLDDNVSHDSVHMFGSEGGGEADGDLDINNLIYQKINDLEDDEESTTIMDDDASTTYSKGRGGMLGGSVDILPVEHRDDPLSYPDSRKGWSPPPGRPMDETIAEITANGRFASQEEPLPRRHEYDMGPYSHSQGASLYNPSATPDSFIGMQPPPPPKLYHNDPKRMMHDYSRHYYADEHQERLPRGHERERPRYTPRSNHTYGSASVLPANSEYHRQGHRQHYRSQDLGLPYSKYSPFIPGGRRPGHHNTYNMTPTEGTDGTVTPQTALTADYNYLSSSSTSLTSTNVSGNLSQPSRRPQIFN